MLGPLLYWFILLINGQTNTEVNIVQTKSRDWLAFLFGEHFRKLTVFKKLYTAVGLLLLASVLLLSVAGALQERTKAKSAVLPPDSPPAKTTSAEALPESKGAEQPETATLNEAPMRPVNGTVTQAFGWQEQPLYKDWRYHNGIDISVRSQEDVRAMFSGKVTDIYIDKHYGRTVVVESREYKIFYGSLSAADVTKGSFVKRGQALGKTGICRDEPAEHLHLAIRKNDNYIDPTSIF